MDDKIFLTKEQFKIIVDCREETYLKQENLFDENMGFDCSKLDELFEEFDFIVVTEINHVWGNFKGRHNSQRFLGNAKGIYESAKELMEFGR